MVSSFSDNDVNKINLAEMKDVNIKIALLGDGMSGKTQILLAYHKIIINYLLRLHRFHSNEESKEHTPNEDS